MSDVNRQKSNQQHCMYMCVCVYCVYIYIHTHALTYMIYIYTYIYKHYKYFQTKEVNNFIVIVLLRWQYMSLLIITAAPHGTRIKWKSNTNSKKNEEFCIRNPVVTVTPVWFRILMEVYVTAIYYLHIWAPPWFYSLLFPWIFYGSPSAPPSSRACAPVAPWSRWNIYCFFIL